MSLDKVGIEADRKKGGREDRFGVFLLLGTALFQLGFLLGLDYLSNLHCAVWAEQVDLFSPQGFSLNIKC